MSTSSPVPPTASSIADRLEQVRRRMTRACRAAGRDPAGATLTAVSKTQPPAAIDAALAAGQRLFGENRVQEAQGRWLDRRVEGLELRLIGPLQTNKAEDAVRLFDVIETLDRPRLAEALAQAAAKTGRGPRLLVQINTGEEPQKAGAPPGDAAGLMALARDLGLTVEGLMCIPPLHEAPGPHFALLSRLADRLALPVRSMGMSADYETALRFGATHVRVGSAIFGERSV